MAIPDLRRYTELPSLVYMLAHRRLTLLDQSSWDDKNDSYFFLISNERPFAFLSGGRKGAHVIGPGIGVEPAYARAQHDRR